MIKQAIKFVVMWVKVLAYYVQVHIGMIKTAPMSDLMKFEQVNILTSEELDEKRERMEFLHITSSISHMITGQDQYASMQSGLIKQYVQTYAVANADNFDELPENIRRGIEAELDNLSRLIETSFEVSHSRSETIAKTASPINPKQMFNLQIFAFANKAGVGEMVVTHLSDWKLILSELSKDDGGWDSFDEYEKYMQERLA